MIHAIQDISKVKLKIIDLKRYATYAMTELIDFF